MRTARPTHYLRHSLLVLLGFAALFGWLWAYASAHGGYLAESDLYEEYLPTFLSPMTWWSSFEFGGAPAFAVPSESMWYLPHLLFRDAIHSQTAYVVCANVIAACGAYLCVFNLTRSKTAALFSGAAYGLSEAMMERASHLATMHTVAWLPWVVWSVDRMRQDRPWHSMAISAIVVATFLFAGNPQTFLYGAYTCLLYALVGGIVEKAGWRFYAAGTGAVLLGGLLTSVATLPMLELSTLTARQTVNFGQFARALSAPQLLSIVFPTILHDGRGTPTYVGLLTLIFAVGSLRRLLSNWRVAFWLAITIAAILIALGDLTPAARLAFELPFYDRFRIATRHLYLAAFGLAMLAGLTIAQIRQRQASVFTVAAAAGAVLVTLAAGAGAIARWPTLFEFDDLITLPWRLPIWDGIIWVQLGIGLLAAALALAFAWAPRSRLIVAALIVLLVGDLIYALPYDVTPYGIETVVLSKEAALNPSVHATRLAAGLDPGQQRLLSPSGTHLDAVVPAAFARLWRIPIAGGYNSMMLASYNRIALMGNNGSVEQSLFADQDAALDALAVKYLVVHAEDLAVTDTFERHGLTWNAEPLDVSAGPEECRRIPGTSVSLGLPADRRIRAVAVVAHLACAENVPQGIRVATARVSGPGGVLVERELRAGIDVAEGGLSNPDYRQRVRHAPATVFDADSRGYSYLTQIDMPSPVQGVLLTIVMDEGPGRLVIDRVSAVDEDGHALPQGLSALLLANSGRWQETTRFATSRATDRGRDDTIQGEQRYVVFENRRALPRAWLVRETIRVGEKDLETAVHYSLLPTGRRFSAAETALLPPDATWATTYRPGDESVRVHPVQDSVITVDVSTTTPRFLVLSENIYPGWQATIDQARTRIWRTDGTLMGVEIPVGQHVVTFRFRPGSFRWGAGISVAALVVVLGVLWRTRLRPAGILFSSHG